MGHRPHPDFIAQVYSPLEFQAELTTAVRSFEELLGPNGQWVYQGEHSGVQMYVGVPPILPGRDPVPGPSVLPLYRSEIVIPDCRPIEALACVHQTAYRCLFQPRIRTAYYLRRFSMFHSQFYAVLAFGSGFESRDFVGVQAARFFDHDGHEVGHPSQDSPRVDLVHTSVEDPRVPPQEGKTRARHWHSGFRFSATNGGTLVQYISQLDYGAPIPAYIARVMYLEVPLTVSRLKEAHRLLGFPPYVLDHSHTVAMQVQSFDVDTRSFSISALVMRPGFFTIVLDSRRMYKQGS
ncbi:hypothetical protein OC846_003972 [Tilletia horrida]|uniref:START domain-containing protein n=1 Tax=Tilletia horrida TaxID=155126 RepID=A0AAN6JR87_9BASI|nr:hypothetical protein OC845_004002 [Tilletia horrida]KAK0549666.1 hypothetical protein OC846_003972 [Tilletia horrida]